MSTLARSILSSPWTFRLTSLAYLALLSLVCGLAYADGGQNAAGVANAVTQAAPALLSGQWLSGGIVLALGLLHVLALQSQHWQSQKTVAALVQGLNNAVTALQSSAPVPTSTTTTVLAPPPQTAGH